MPPKSKNSIEQEGRILLAISALQKKEIHYVWQAAHVYMIPESTLKDWLHSSVYWAEQCTNSHKLTKNKEKLLYNKYYL